MFNLEKAISNWRHSFAFRRGFLKEDLDELERHLRDHVSGEVKRGKGEDEAFREAVAAIGSYDEAEAEYRKVYWSKIQRNRLVQREFVMGASIFKNYLKTALRSLTRKKGFSFINIAGLTLGMACCLIIFQFVAFEYSFDQFHENEPDLYRVVMAGTRGDDEIGAGGAFTPQAMGPALAETIPEILHVARVHPLYDGALISTPTHPERVFEEEDIFHVDSAFLEMFTFPLVHGAPESALEPGTVLISESAAEKYFGSENPIGEVLNVTGWVGGTHQVTGVFRDVPSNSHLQFDFLLPISDLLTGTADYSDEPEGGWSWNNFLTYVQLHPNADRSVVDQKMTEMLMARRGDELREQGMRAHLYAQPLRDVYLNAAVETPAGLTGSYRTVYFFTIIGLVTLLIALVNYVNLATARALDRAREVGVRKVVGAQRNQLIVQFFFESALINVVALALAVMLTESLRPLVNELTGIQLSHAVWVNPWFWMAFIATFIVSTVVAGLYPAFVLSSFRPVSVLKGRVGTFGGQLWLRRGLVVFQFAAAVVLIGGTVVVYHQLDYMRRIDLGLDLEQVLTVYGPRLLPDGTDTAAATTTFVQELGRLASVREVATSTSLPGQGFNWNGASTWRAEEDQASAISGVVSYIDTSFASLYDLTIVAGKGFDMTTPTFGSGGASEVLANETAVRALGFSTPEEAIYHPLLIGGTEAHIIGVLRDFNWTSAHQTRQNIFFGRTNGGHRISIRIETSDLPSTIAAIERIYSDMFPGNVFRYAFVDDAFDQQYRSEQRFAMLFTLFAGLAISIACLGLFGLASFSTQQRTKEIGVRKVLGATVYGLVAMLSIDFLKLVIVAVLIASPVAYLLMNRWLESFAYRVEIGPGLFMLVGIISLLIALTTVAFQSIRAALSDPVSSLRVE